jgi:UPF0755 protein
MGRQADRSGARRGTPLTGARPPGSGWTRYEPGVGGAPPTVYLPTGGGGSSYGRPPGDISGGGRGRRRTRLMGYLLVAMLALIIGVGVGYARAYFSDGEIGREVTVEVKEGSSLRAIAAQLEEAGVVAHARSFEIRAEADGYATRFMPGTYRLHINEPYATLIDKLLAGTKPATVKVTIPEGTTLKQTAALVAKAMPAITARKYQKIARDAPPRLDLSGYKKGTTLEGMLFPATYEVPRQGATAKGFVRDQLTAFRRAFDKLDLRRAQAANLTAYDIVIIASMVEREARVAAERPVVAAVIWNRLHKNMLLQIDATVQYALGETKPTLTYDDLEIDSPYNTYKRAGLPPTPIANPGLAALQAAANPSDDDYLYYVARNDGTGRHFFSTSYEQFLVDKAKAAANAQ